MWAAKNWFYCTVVIFVAESTPVLGGQSSSRAQRERRGGTTAFTGFAQFWSDATALIRAGF
jgi:hypothetical protein